MLPLNETPSLLLGPLDTVCCAIEKSFVSREKCPDRRAVFPERLLIYHAGTGRTTFLAALKMTTVFVFGFFGFIVTPAYLSAEETPWSTTALAAAAAVCPLAFVTLTTAPIVTYIHLKIPPYARISREALTKWIKSRINPSTELDISSMTFLARPKQTTVAFGDLVPTRGLLNPANFKLQPGAASSPGPLIRRGGKWWASTPLREFCVSGFNKEAREPWVWDELQKQIRKGSKR